MRDRSLRSQPRAIKMPKLALKLAKTPEKTLLKPLMQHNSFKVNSMLLNKIKKFLVNPLPQRQIECKTKHLLRRWEKAVKEMTIV